MNKNEGVIHRHCDSCIKIWKCTKKPQPGESCHIMSCELKCDAKFHSCKQQEHNLLCPNVKEPCINAHYGCPAILLRKHRAEHLCTCPASVVVCTAEWNRWPLCSKERQVYIPFTQINPHLHREQLDVALALRDQEMLNHWMNLPRKIQRLMRCYVTPRHPAIPLVSTLWNIPNKRKLKSVSLDDPFFYYDIEDTPRQSAERSDASTLSFTSTDEESPWGRRCKPPGLLKSVCSQLLVKGKETNCDSRQYVAATDTHEKLIITRNGPELIDGGNLVDEDTLSDFSDNFEGHTELDSELWEDTSKHHEANTAETNQSDPFPSDIEKNENCDNNVPEAPVLPYLVTLGLDLSIECMPRYQIKPKSMYTFVCAQQFRRDEYPWHYLNLHSDIHGGLDGWLEQRCPLARYGCSFSKRRLEPLNTGATLTYSATNESFGIKNTVTPVLDNSHDVSLCDLPFEVLRTIGRYLDSFSLRHLSLTCHLMRDVTYSLLQSRGLVVIQWKKGINNKWIPSHKTWFFSTAFSPVEHWRLEGGQHMANHMKTCLHYIKSDIPLPERIQLHGMDHEGNHH